MPRSYEDDRSGGYRERDSPDRGRPPPRRTREERTSLLVRNIPRDTRPDDLRSPFERYGPIKDVYLPRDYYTGEPRGFGFVQFLNPEDAEDAQYEMDRTMFNGREITVVFAEENRKKPDEMRTRERGPGPGYGRRRSPPPRGGSYSRGGGGGRDYSPSPPRRRSRSPPPRRRDRTPSPPPPGEDDGYNGPPRGGGGRPRGRDEGLAEGGFEDRRGPPREPPPRSGGGPPPYEDDQF